MCCCIQHNYHLLILQLSLKESSTLGDITLVKPYQCPSELRDITINYHCFQPNLGPAADQPESWE